MTYTAHEILGGIYEKTVKMTVDRRLRYMPYAQAGRTDTVQKDGTTASELYSYSSLILTVSRRMIDGQQVVAGIHTYGAKAASNCSRTTSRQVTAALRELNLSDGEVYSVKRYLDRGGRFAFSFPRIDGDGPAQWCDVETGEVIA